jgi:DNA invertase Pin-like site-specific DNA recombinase
VEVIGYIRVSQQEQKRSGAGLEAQRRAILKECERRGWQPDAGRLARALDALQEAIDRAGGQRRARPYLDAQRRRLRRRPPCRR